MKKTLDLVKHIQVKKFAIVLLVLSMVIAMPGCAPAGCAPAGPDRYTLTISSTEGGEVTTPGEGARTYDAETVVDLAAEAGEGYQFVNWTGDVEEIDDPDSATTTIIMKDNYSIVANFDPVALPPAVYSLTITSTEGGSVTEPGEGVRTYDAETVVDLAAQEDEGYQFVNWTGDTGEIDDAGSATTTITMRGDYTIVANFDEETAPPPVVEYDLTIGSTDGGSVTTPGEGVFTYEADTVVDLVAQEDESYRFVNWSGNITTIENPESASTTIDMKDHCCITAIFEIIPQYDLTIDSTQGGSVTTPGEGTFTYYEDELVDLLAEPDEGYIFVNWTGNSTTISDHNSSSTNVTIKDHYSITANFAFFSGGNGTAENPYQATDWRHLDNVRNYPDAHFILMNNLDSETEGYDELAGQDANEGKGWQPIGTSDVWFSGAFDGQGYQISDLFIDRPDESNVGIFGVVGQEGAIINVGLVAATVTGHQRVGGLIGQNSGTVSGACSAEGSVTGTAVTHARIGGLIGQNSGTVSDAHCINGSVGGDNADRVGGLVGDNTSTGVVSNCHSTGSSVSGNDRVGGLAGHNSGTISHSYSEGNAAGRDQVGGLLGQNEGAVDGCYAEGSVTGRNDIGGLVGKNNDSSVSDSYSSASVTGGSCVGGLVGKNEGFVHRSYSIGSVAGTGYSGGLIGKHDKGEVSNSFWDTVTSGKESSAAGEGKTTEDMWDITTFAEWDIVLIGDYEDETWYIDDGNDYPRLGWQHAS